VLHITNWKQIPSVSTELAVGRIAFCFVFTRYRVEIPAFLDENFVVPSQYICLPRIRGGRGEGNAGIVTVFTSKLLPFVSSLIHYSLHMLIFGIVKKR
jgi:hypothetical protein